MEHPLLGTRQRRGGGLAELSKLCHKLGLFGRKLGGRHHVKTKTQVAAPITPQLRHPAIFHGNHISALCAWLYRHRHFAIECFESHHLAFDGIDHVNF